MAKHDVASTLDKAIDRRIPETDRTGIIVSVDKGARKIAVRMGSGAPASVTVPQHIDITTLAVDMSVRINTAKQEFLLEGVTGGGSALTSTVRLERLINGLERRIVRLEAIVADVESRLNRGEPSEQIRSAIHHALGAGGAGVTGDIVNG